MVGRGERDVDRLRAIFARDSARHGHTESTSNEVVHSLEGLAHQCPFSRTRFNQICCTRLQFVKGEKKGREKGTRGL
jgi:hypothetical protein